MESSKTCKDEKICDKADELLEEFNIDTSREQELKHLQELEQKINLQENYEIKVMMIEKSFQKLKIDKLQSEEMHNKEIKEKSENQNALKEKNEFCNKSQDRSKKYVRNTTTKAHNFVRPKTYNNEFRETKYGDYFPNYSKQNYYERGYRRARRGARIVTRINNNRGRFRQENKNTFSNRRKIDVANFHPVFKRDKPEEINEEERLINHQSVFEIVPATFEEEEEMLREAIQLSKQQLFIEKLQKKQLEKALQDNMEAAEIFEHDLCIENNEKDKIHCTNSNNAENFNVSENNKRENMKKKFTKEQFQNEYKYKYSENTQSSRKSKSVDTYSKPSSSKFRSNSNKNFNQSHERNNKNFEDNRISGRLFINSIKSIKQSNESKALNSELQNKYSERTVTLEERKSSSKDKDDWNNIASNDLKTMLNIGGCEGKRKYLNNTSNFNNKYSEQNESMRSGTDTKYYYGNNNYTDQRNTSHHFQKYNSNNSYKRGNMQRMRNNQRHYGERGGSSYHTTNYKKFEWRPYSKQLEEGRFDNVPPRFKQMTNQNYVKDS